MRARLLDMGEVSAARSQSIYHAIASAITPDDVPVILLQRPASSFVSIGIDHDPAAEIELELCLEERIPVLRRLLSGEAMLTGENRLLFQFLMPEQRVTDLRPLTPEPLAEACRTLGLSSTLAPSGEVLVRGEDGDLRQIGRSQTGTVAGCYCLVASLARDPEPSGAESVLINRSGIAPNGHAASCLAWELDERPAFATIAEALIEAVENSSEVELVPSMPTPDEMDAIYDWDERLALDLEAEIQAGNPSHRTDQLVC